MSAPPSASSWFQQVRHLCLQYQLEHPLLILQNPPKESQFRKLIKSRIVDYWEVHLRENASKLTSIPYFKPNYMSLLRPHPIWLACGSNSFECHKAVTTAKMLSGKYLTDQLQRHWTQNKDGFCLLPACQPKSIGSLEHLLLHCPALQSTRFKLFKLCFKISLESSHLLSIISSVFLSGDQTRIMQLILDCTAMPEVIKSNQTSGTETRDRLLYIGRTWCYSIHRERMTQLGLLSFR